MIICILFRRAINLLCTASKWWSWEVNGSWTHVSLQTSWACFKVEALFDKSDSYIKLAAPLPIPSRPVVLNSGWFLPQGNPLAISGATWGKCQFHLVGRDKECFLTSYNEQDNPHNDDLASNFMSGEVEKPFIDIRNSSFPSSSGDWGREIISSKSTSTI